MLIESTVKPIAICLQETWLMNETNIQNIKEIFNKYNLYFKNRNTPNGGVGIMILKTIPQFATNLNTHLEAISYNIKYKSKLISICSLYLPPKKHFTIKSLEQLDDELLPHHIIMGDINGHNNLWGSVKNSYRGVKYAQFINNKKLTILNTGEPTHIIGKSKKSTHIDVTVSTPEISVDIDWNIYTDTLGSDHYPIIINMKNEDTNYVISPYCKYKTENVEWKEYSRNIHIEIEGNNIDEKCENLEISILNAAENNLPKKNTNKRKILVPWWNNECQNAIRNRNKAFKIFNRNINDENYIEYKRTRALARKIIKNAKKNAWKEFISKINKDTSVKEIFQYIKRIKGKNSARPICLLINGNIIDDPKEIADNIAEHFSNVSDDQNYTPAYRANKNQNEHPINFDSNTQFEYNEPFTMAELKYVLGSVKGTSAGPDGIRYEMIKNIRNIELSKILQFYNDI